ncbi:S-methyl-5-thioribose kinase [Paraglaciecola sp. 2405UD69-4]|uniref:S-methyl-5-thioribose kinase n=1 Tax=Paraglaciecola sp. 2405UD69-4 TaxID=3391836 RepID=UPI0039C9AA96
MSYFQLNANNLVSFLSSLPEMQNRFSGFEYLKVEEITNGNMNFAFVVTNQQNPTESIFCKQSPPFIKVMGEDWPLTRNRMSAEIHALAYQAKVSPSTAPKMYYQSEDLSVVIMENLQCHSILRDGLIRGEYFPKLAEDIANYLGATLFFSSDFGLDSQAKKALVSKADNPDMCMISEDFIFTYPFEHHDMNDYNPVLPQKYIDEIQKDPLVRAHVAQMKYLFSTSKQALLHGDLHTGSIMLNQQQTYVIDAEFAFVGPMGFDIGALIANLYLSYFSHVHRESVEAQKYSKWLLQQIELIWKGFEAKFSEYWYDSDKASDNVFMGKDLTGECHNRYRQMFLQQIFQDTLGFAACKIIRRILGIAKVADFMQFDDLAFRAKLEAHGLLFAKKMLLKRNEFASFNELNKVVSQMTNDHI